MLYKVVAKRGNSDFLVVKPDTNVQDTNAKGHVYEAKTGKLFEATLIQVILKWGYWENAEGTIEVEAKAGAKQAERVQVDGAPLPRWRREGVDIDAEDVERAMQEWNEDVAPEGRDLLLATGPTAEEMDEIRRRIQGQA